MFDVVPSIPFSQPLPRSHRSPPALIAMLAWSPVIVARPATMFAPASPPGAPRACVPGERARQHGGAAAERLRKGGKGG